MSADQMNVPVVVVQWMDSDGAICRDLDYREDGCWMGWHSHAEHVEHRRPRGQLHAPIHAMDAYPGTTARG